MDSAGGPHGDRYRAGRLIATRLAFHAFDGLLAADALHTQARWRYATMWHGIGLALLSALTLIARPSLLVVSVPAYLAGALVAGLTGGVSMPKRIVGMARPGWTLGPGRIGRLPE